MHNATYAVIPKRCSLFKQPRSERWYARIKMDDGAWYRVATKKLELETIKSRALELYYEATIKGKNNLPQNKRSLSSIAKSIVKKLESMRDTSQWKQTYQAYIYAINKTCYSNPVKIITMLTTKKRCEKHALTNKNN
jgi:hypothetical protein